MMRTLWTYAIAAASCFVLSPAFVGPVCDVAVNQPLFAQGHSDLEQAARQLAVREAEALNATKPDDRADQRKPSEATVRTGAAPDAALVEKSFKVAVTLGDGRQLRGRMRVRVPERLSIVHVVDGIQYRKIVRPEQIHAVEFKRWRGRLVRQQESGQIFQFDVDRYSIELSGGQVLKRDGDLFGFLTQFVLENDNGTVQLFSFWGDLQKKDGSWFTGMQGPSTSRVAAHKDVIQRIQFDES
ncbi:MAG: hypothetical protein RIF32_13985 [Leptospirales bacterium]|jgi:hypothetical protein